MNDLELTPTQVESRPTCTAIVCAYNEEKTIGGVIEALRLTPFIDEIIVVDDGSADATPDIVRQAAQTGRVIGLCFEQNRGKAYAMAEAAGLAHSDSLLYVDADLHNWSADFAGQILSPLWARDAEMVIGYPVRDDLANDPDRHTPFLHWLSGQRAVWRADLLPVLDVLRTSRFGVETLINLHYRQRRQRIMCLPLHGLFHPVKGDKEQPLKAMWSYAREGFEIAQAVARHYPIALAAYGLKPDYVDRVLRFDARPPAEQLVQWTRQTLFNTGRLIDRLPLDDTPALSQP